MPRRSSGGRSARPAPRPAATRNPPPQPVNHAPPPAHVQGNTGGSMLGNIGSTIAQGMAFGTAAAPVTIATTIGGSDACSMYSKAFQDCLNSYGNEISKCQFYMDMLAECRRNSGSTFSS
ncbi:Cox19-like CHCH family protein [Forsythia ovata]|uniref:Cox19-like CHCH family protein n=1 Tax=Forsythia ovata TaxID=205694 RepID=A0ABD1QKU0_9LAMI